MLCPSCKDSRFPFLAKPRAPKNAISATSTAKKTRAATAILSPSDNDSQYADANCCLVSNGGRSSQDDCCSGCLETFAVTSARTFITKNVRVFQVMF